MAALLVMGEEQKAQLKSLKEYAEAHPMTMNDQLDIMNGAPAAGERPEYQRAIPVGYKVVFTIEPNTRQVPIRHLSVSIKGKGKFPHPEACQLIMEELGFQNKWDSGFCQIQYEGDIAISIAELV